MTKYSITDYTTKFQYKELTPIRGQPTLDTILQLYRQVKRNAQSVPTKLGGGQLGYLGLVLRPEDYRSIPNAEPFHRPVDLGTFIVQTPRASRTSSTTGTVTAMDIANQKAIHEENVRIYWECQAVEQALRNQIIEAIDKDYLDALRNNHTDMINDPIPDIFDYLTTNYGQITEQELSDKEDALKTLVYDPTQPVDTVFNKINWFQDLCNLCNNQKSDRQLVQLSYIIFNRSKAFMDVLLKWNKKPHNEKTYNNFKKHMREGYHALREVGALTVRDSELHYANLVKDMTTHQEKMAQDIKESLSDQLSTSLMEALMVSQSPLSSIPSLDETSSLSSPSMNSASSDATIQALVKLVKSLETKVDKLSNEKTKNLNSNNEQATANKGINPRTGKPWRRHCWTHGCCTHKGVNCPSKAPGHKDEADFRDRMGGSNKDCYPIKK